MPSFLALPDEIVQVVLSFVPPKDWSRFVRTCRRFRHMLDASDTVFWERVFRMHFGASDDVPPAYRLRAAFITKHIETQCWHDGKFAYNRFPAPASDVYSIGLSDRHMCRGLGNGRVEAYRLDQPEAPAAVFEVEGLSTKTPMQPVFVTETWNSLVAAGMLNPTPYMDLFDIDARRNIFHMPSPAAISCAVFFSEPQSVWFGRADGARVIVPLHQDDTGQWQCGEPRSINDSTSVVYELIPNQSQTLVAALAKNGCVQVHRVADADLLYECTDPVVAGVFDPQAEQRLVSGARNGSVVLWDGETPQQSWALSGPVLALVPSGPLVYALTERDGALLYALDSRVPSDQAVSLRQFAPTELVCSLFHRADAQTLWTVGARCTAMDVRKGLQADLRQWVVHSGDCRAKYETVVCVQRNGFAVSVESCETHLMWNPRASLHNA